MASAPGPLPAGPASTAPTPLCKCIVCGVGFSADWSTTTTTFFADHCAKCSLDLRNIRKACSVDDDEDSEPEAEDMLRPVCHCWSWRSCVVLSGGRRWQQIAAIVVIIQAQERTFARVGVEDELLSSVLKRDWCFHWLCYMICSIKQPSSSALSALLISRGRRHPNPREDLVCLKDELPKSACNRADAATFVTVVTCLLALRSRLVYLSV